MKPFGHPAALLLILFVCFAGYVVVTTQHLPPRVATHFNASGHADGWMSRTSILKFTLGFGFGLPAFLVTLFGLLRYLPNSMINIPDRDYWLAPERRDATYAMVWHHSFWLGSLTVALMAGLHYRIPRANAVSPPGISTMQITVLCGSFLLGTLAWILTLLRKLKR